jgi:hypothetical protein
MDRNKLFSNSSLQKASEFSCVAGEVRCHSLKNRPAAPEEALVLLWGLEVDPVLAAVRNQLSDLEVPTVLADQAKVLATEIRLDVGESIEGSLRTPDYEIDLNAVTAVYVRPHDCRWLPAIAEAGPQSSAWLHAVEVDDILTSWSEITPALVVNRVDAMAVNGSKPYQSTQIRDLGFSVPETLITTDPAAAAEFWERHGTVIYKSVSAVRSRVTRLCREHIERLGDISCCPTQFQQYIDGTDYRVHVVGDEVFACEVICDADDYRYPGPHPVEIRSCRLPEEVEERSRLMAAAMQLSVAGIDLRRTPGGTWFCFEVNPSPGFICYEEMTGQPIAQAIARLLANGPENTSSNSFSRSLKFLSHQKTAPAKWGALQEPVVE